MNNAVSRFKFKLIITLLFSNGNGQQRIDDNKKCRQIAGNFDCHADVAVRRGAHRPMEHIQGSGLHWKPLDAAMGECMCCIGIAPAAAMVDEFVENTQNTDKTQLLASNYGTFRSPVVNENCNPNTDPLLSSSMQQAV